MARLVEKNIDGREYKFGLLNPFKANILLIKLTKMIGPVAGSFGNIKDVKSIMDADLSNIMEGLCSSLDENEIENVMKTLFSQVLCDGNKMTDDFVDTEFKGKLNELYKIMFAALEVQFGDFFGGKGVLAGFMKKADTILEK